MKISIITLFPKVFEPLIKASMLAKAQELGKLKVNVINLRDFGLGSHRQVDDRVYGGGVGMILRVEPIDAALNSLGKGRKILLTPQGIPLTQEKVANLAKEKHFILVCGKYEGVDERVRQLIDEEISVGDYILSGGEIPAMVILDSVSRLLPGVLEKKATENESFTKTDINKEKTTLLLEPPQYTRPETYKGKAVPDILLSGNHQKIAEWRSKEAIKKTRKRRPDLLDS